MKTNIKLSLALSLLAALHCSIAFGQTSFAYFEDKWNEYKQRSITELQSLHQRHFNDSVSLDEMKEAFHKNKDKRFHQSPYAGLDSVGYIRGYGQSVMLISPLQRHKNNKIRECRGVWNWFGRYKLIELLDKNGIPQKQLLEKLNNDKEPKWLDGEILKLGEPRWYMGFIVSPRPYWDIYDEGKLVVRTGYSPYCEPDFFSYANRTKQVLDGDWYSKIDAGAQLLGALHSTQSSANIGKPERTFSVLLYEKPKIKSSKQSSVYTLELLQPENPDKETLELFQSFRKFVESIPAKAFKPYYTTDFRIMTGRYYQVTVNKCGWLVEDYLYINP